MAERNPPWTRDELILALNLYVQHEGNPPGKQSPEITSLSDTLNAMGRSITGRNEDYRNPNGVYMKVMNFRRFDPRYLERGRVGLQRGGKGDEIIWRDFFGDHDKLRRAALAITANVEADQVPLPTPEDDDEVAEAEEGRLLTRLHRKRERNRKLIEKKKAAHLKRNGNLACEACGFDFERVYGERVSGYIEAHHIKPLHTLTPGTKTSLDDLVLLCANCHRVIHARQPWLSMDELRNLLTKKSPAKPASKIHQEVRR